MEEKYLTVAGLQPQSNAAEVNRQVAYDTLPVQTSAGPPPAGLFVETVHAQKVSSSSPVQEEHHYTVRLVTSCSDFHFLKSSWNRLLANSGITSIFLTWEWLYTWYEVYNRLGKLRIILVCDKDEIIGIAPFKIHTEKKFGFLPVRTLSFLATGEDESEEICSSYLDIISKKGCEKEVVGETVKYLMENSNSWDELRLNEIPHYSDHLPALENAFGTPRFVCRRKPVANCLYVPLPGTWEEFMGRLSHDSRSKVKRLRAKLSNVENFEMVIITNPAEVTACFDQFALIHTKRWNMKGFPGAFADKNFTEFHKKLLTRISDENIVMTCFYFDKKLIAGNYSYIHNDRVYNYQLCFDPDILVNLGLGRQITYAVIDFAIQNENSEFDFLHGTRNSYKAEWHPLERRMFELRITNLNVKTRIQRFLESTHERIRTAMKYAA